jgi:hypothetical protein
MKALVLVFLLACFAASGVLMLDVATGSVLQRAVLLCAGTIFVGSIMFMMVLALSGLFGVVFGVLRTPR